MIFAIYGRNIKANELGLLENFLQTCASNSVDCIIYETFRDHLRLKRNHEVNLPVFHTHEDLPGKADFMISIGGDGTMLDAVSIVGDSGIPVLGINFGRMGFLAATSKSEIAATINALLQGTFTLVQRELLEVLCDKPIFQGQVFGLNEFTIQRKNSSSMISITAYLNGELLNTYWADGVIVATATGSTGYSLSCGGPIIYPAAQCFVITPVAPHNLNVRPLVLPNDVELKFEVQGRGNKFLATIDTRVETIDSSYKFTIRKAGFAVKMVSLNNKTFINALKSKLLWGMDQRN